MQKNRFSRLIRYLMTERKITLRKIKILESQKFGRGWPHPFLTNTLSIKLREMKGS